jgi:hypothetical protein
MAMTAIEKVALRTAHELNRRNIPPTELLRPNLLPHNTGNSRQGWDLNVTVYNGPGVLQSGSEVGGEGVRVFLTTDGVLANLGGRLLSVRDLVDRATRDYPSTNWRLWPEQVQSQIERGCERLLRRSDFR